MVVSFHALIKTDPICVPIIRVSFNQCGKFVHLTAGNARSLLPRLLTLFPIPPLYPQ